MSVAWLFPGQGSQYVGMAGAWAERVPAARAALVEASDVLDLDIVALLRDGPADVLADTYNQQPAVLAASVAVLRAVAEVVPPPQVVAGHSLGEYSALVAAGALAYPDALRLVRERGRLMRLAGERSPGSMAAVLGVDDATVEATCAAIAGVQVANYNAPGQVVISGEREAVARAGAALRAAGAARIVPLPITIAAHSSLMAPVAAEFASAVAASPLQDARVPVVANVTVRALKGSAEIRDELTRQLTASVRWSEGVRAMLATGARTFYEIGPGNVLVGLVKRIAKGDGLEPEVSLSAMGEPDA
jgi:[acyl-carrier-protein] S-malonyltransferase